MTIGPLPTGEQLLTFINLKLLAMYKVTETAWTRFCEGRPFKSVNTEIRVYDRGRRREFWLYNTMIALYTPGQLTIKTGGWDTCTTKERLRNCPCCLVHIQTKQGQMYLNGEPWNGEPRTFKAYL